MPASNFARGGRTFNDYDKPVAIEDMTRAQRVIAFIEEYCRAPEGTHVGKQLVLEDFQKEFIYDIYDNVVPTAIALLSIARKNGKTALIAGLLLAHTCGPEAVLNSQIISGAQSREQAAIVFKLAHKMIMLEPRLQDVTHIVPSSKQIFGTELNVEYRALSADATTAHGLSPRLAILDESGQVKGPTNDFVDAITTAQGAYDDALLIGISTQAPSDADLLSVMIDDALRSPQKDTVCHLYAAPADCELMDEEAMRMANPALGKFRSIADLKRQLLKAVRIPSEESKARNLLLNQRVSRETLYVGASIWKENNKVPDLNVLRNATTVAMGLDLSGRHDLTAAIVAACDEHGDVHTLPYVFCPSEDIEERARRDKAPYDLWVKEGHLIPIGGRVMDYDQIVRYLKKDLAEKEIEITHIEYDKWRMDIFKKCCEDESAFGWAEFHGVGQGYRDQSPRLESFSSLLLNNRVRHGNHPLLNMAAANAIAVADPTGSIKLDKRKSTQRIDPMIGLTQAAFRVTEGDEGDDFDPDVLIG